MREKKSKDKICICCNKEFKSYRNTAKYCSVRCANVFYNNSGKNKDFRKKSVENTLRTVVWQARNRSKKKGLDFDLTDEYMLNLLKSQNNKCSATGLQLESSQANTKKYKSPYTVSLDRIDSSKGYTKDNIQIVCVMFNEMKNIYSIEQVTLLCKSYILHNKIVLDEQ
jgi:hypothetical protein